ncbi:MAG: hypothetical protein WD027_06960 [Gaiellales bacterium]
MSRALLFAALAASLLAPAGGVALAVAAATSPSYPPAPGTAWPTESDKDEIVAIHNELEALDRRATPGSVGQIGEARRIAREARTWAVQFDAEPEWEELALATSALAALIADALEHPDAFAAANYDRAVERLGAAVRALPHDRQER